MRNSLLVTLLRTCIDTFLPYIYDKLFDGNFVKDLLRKNFTIVMTSSDFADDVIKSGVFDGSLEALGKIALFDLSFGRMKLVDPSL